MEIVLHSYIIKIFLPLGMETKTYFLYFSSNKFSNVSLPYNASSLTRTHCLHRNILKLELSDLRISKHDYEPTRHSMPAFSTQQASLHMLKIFSNLKSQDNQAES